MTSLRRDREVAHRGSLSKLPRSGRRTDRDLADVRERYEQSRRVDATVGITWAATAQKLFLVDTA